MMKTLLLNSKQIDQKLNRLAFQIYEDNYSSGHIILAGIINNGFELAKKLAVKIAEISPIDVTLVEVTIKKHSTFSENVSLNMELNLLNGKTVILIDDVMNSGKTMLHAMKPFLDSELQKLRTLVLVDRNHKSYPVSSDFVGLSLATTLKENVSVEFKGNEITAWLE